MKNKWRLKLSTCGLVPGLLILFLVVAACNSADVNEQTEPVLKSKSFLPDFPGPEAFVSGFSNPYLAFETGKVFHYAGETEDGEETIVVTVTDETKMIMGVEATVVRDIAYLDGEMVEKTDDWYAEDMDGNVWYFGEYSEEYEDGELVGTEGSWEAGVDGALPGVLMFAHPKMGMKYQQEYYEGEAEDMAMVINLDKMVDIDFGTFEGCLETMEWTPLEPGEREHKFYKEDIGLLMELQPKGGRIIVELVSVDQP